MHFLCEGRDDKGKVNKLEKIIYFNTGEENRTEHPFVYNAEGKQSTYSSPFYELITSSWTAGNLTKVVYKHEYTVSDDREYSDIPNRVFPELNLYLFGHAVSPEEKHLFADELGLRSANLMKRVQFNNTNGESQTQTFSYVLDDKGRPVQIKVTDGVKDQETISISYVK